MLESRHGYDSRDKQAILEKSNRILHMKKLVPVSDPVRIHEQNESFPTRKDDLKSAQERIPFPRRREGFAYVDGGDISLRRGRRRRAGAYQGSPLGDSPDRRWPRAQEEHETDYFRKFAAHRA